MIFFAEQFCTETNLANILRKFYQKIRNKLIFRSRDGGELSLNQLAAKMSEVSGVEVDVGFLSRVINSKHLLDAWQLTVFCKVLGLTTEEQWELSYAIVKDLAQRLSIEINLSVSPPTGFLLFKNINDVAEERKAGNLITAVEILRGLFEWRNAINKIDPSPSSLLLKIIVSLNAERNMLLIALHQPINAERDMLLPPAPAPDDPSHPWIAAPKNPMLMAKIYDNIGFLLEDLAGQDLEFSNASHVPGLSLIVAMWKDLMAIYIFRALTAEEGSQVTHNDTTIFGSGTGNRLMIILGKLASMGKLPSEFG